MIRVKKLADVAVVPTRANQDDAGIDLYSAEDVEYTANNILVMVPTKLAIAVPKGHVGLIRDRSSVSTKMLLKVTAGVVDCGYTGEVMIALLNVASKSGMIRAGQKIAQIVILPVNTEQVVEVDSLEASARGSAGFGSSGE